jgi:hypothetical protein
MFTGMMGIHNFRQDQCSLLLSGLQEIVIIFITIFIIVVVVLGICTSSSSSWNALRRWLRRGGSRRFQMDIRRLCIRFILFGNADNALETK